MLATSARPARTLRVVSHLLLVLVALAGAACGGAGSGPGGADAGSSASGGPDVGLAQQHLLESVNMSAEGHARFAEFKESGRQQDGAGEFQSLIVSFKGVLEFTGDCYYNKERKAGDRVPFEAEIEYAQGPEGWQKVGMGLYPLETP